MNSPIRMTVKNDEFSKAVVDLQRRFNDLRPLFIACKVIMDRSIMKNFRMQGRPQKWPSLAPLTLENRKAEGTLKGSPILQRYGTLRQSIGTEVLEIGKTQMVYGTRQIKAAMLQFGGTIRPKNSKYLAIPVRGTKGRPRDFENTFVPRGRRVIMQAVKGQEPKILFILKTEVVQKPRPFLMFQEEDADAITQTASAFAFGDKGNKYAGLLKGLG